MKTLNDILREIDQTIKENSGKDVSDRQKSIARKKLEMLKLAKIYLEGSPNEDHTVKQLDIAGANIIILQSRYPSWYKECAVDGLGNPKYKNPEAKYATETGLKEKKMQLRFLNYILTT